MCYDLSFSADIESIFDYLPDAKRSGQLDIFAPTFHKLGMAYPKWPIALNEGEMVVEPCIWGPIPNFVGAKISDPKERLRTIKKDRPGYLNATVENMLTPGKMWNKMRHQRCIIFVTGMFEHRHVEGWDHTIPYFIKNRKHPIIPVAGIWAESRIPDVDIVEKQKTFSLLTREANSKMRAIHNGGKFKWRMPMQLTWELAYRWLQPDQTDKDLQDIVAYEVPSDELDAWPVKSVRKPHPDDASVIERIEYEGEPPLVY